jgi:hypothetical protein
MTQSFKIKKPPSVIIVKCNVKGQLIEELVVEWLREVWDGPGALIKKSGMLILYAFRHLSSLCNSYG